MFFQYSSSEPYNLDRCSSNMARLRCSNYGFECDFVAEGEEKQVIENFRQHTLKEHGIDYSLETLKQFVNH